MVDPQGVHRRPPAADQRPQTTMNIYKVDDDAKSMLGLISCSECYITCHTPLVAVVPYLFYYITTTTADVKRKKS